MAEKRMFAKSIVLSDAFLDMPMSARSLYFTLGMMADDDGFVGAPKSAMRQCGASQDDLAILISKRYLLGFASGVVVIKHWRINNFLRRDRHVPTTYTEELSTLTLDGKGAYIEKQPGQPSIESLGQPVVDQRLTTGQPSIEEYREVEGRLEEDSLDKYSSVQEDQSRACAREDSSLTDEKKLYGKYVFLTLREYSSLLNDLGLTEFRRCRERADVPENADTQDWVALIRRYHEGGADT